MTGRSPARRRARGDDGSALMLMPAAVLILLVLGAIAADLSHVHTAQRTLQGVAGSIANDAVTFGVDLAELRQGAGTEYPLDDARIRRAVNESLDRHRNPIRPYRYVAHTVDRSTRTVSVTLESEVEHIFAKALPGAADRATIRATGTATAEQG